MNKVTRKADMIIDLQYGSTGKGLLAGYLGVEREYDVVMNANMPNAGHTYIDQRGQIMIHKVLPSGVVSPACRYVLLGPGSVFDPGRLGFEMRQLAEFGYDHFKVVIHPNAIVLAERHRTAETVLDTIGSTKQGAGGALIEKIERNVSGGPLLARDKVDLIHASTNNEAVIATHDLYRHIISSADNILMEGAQGYSLGQNQEFWPYTTSRECTPARFMSDMMMPLTMLRDVYGVARMHPIRVGGTSGGHYPDQIETSWKALGVEKEFTTVTNKERRVFTFSKRQLDDAIWECQPDGIFLNFVNYDEDLGDMLVRHYGNLIRWIGMGPHHDDVKPRIT